MAGRAWLSCRSRFLRFAWACWSGFGAWGRLAVRCVVTRSGWSGGSGWRPAAGVEQVHPFVLAVPACGQVQGEVAAAVPGDAGGDVDQVAADRRAARPGVGA